MVNYYNPNIVDFSNPESVARMQSPILNPFGTYNPNANPNIRPPTCNTQPVSNNCYTVYTNPYIAQYKPGYNMDNLSPDDTARFMIPKPGNKRIPVGMMGIPKPPKPSKYAGLTYTERKLLPPPVAVIKGRIHKPHRERQIRVERRVPEYVPNKPYTDEELNPDNYIVKFIVDTPLDWSQEDYKELIDLLDKIWEYDKALAVVIVEFVKNRATSGFNEYSREKYERMFQYLQNKLEELKRNEKEYKNIIDYRAPYRYRELPIYYTNDEGEYMFPIQEECMARIKIDPTTKKKVYQYDRGRDELLIEEWEIFKLRAFRDMEKGVAKILAKEMMELNRHLDPNKPVEQVPELPSYNPFDAVSVKLYNMKKAEREYTIHKNFFKHVLRHRMTEVEFENWWYGTETNPQKIQSQQDQHELWARDMHNRHLQFLHTLQPVNYAQQGAICRQIMIQRLREYDKGLEKPNLSLPECVALWGYLGGVRPHELNLEKQQRERAIMNQRMAMHTVFDQNANRITNNAPKNFSPQTVIPKYNSVDPNYGVPECCLDAYINDEEMKKKGQIVIQSARNMGRHPRLHTLYK